MTLHAVARRYASALFDVVSKTAAIDRAQADLAAFAGIVRGHAGLAQVFSSQAVPPQKKRAVLDALLAHATDVLPEVRRLLVLMADRDRLHLVADVSAAFDERVRQAAKVISAHVVTAAPLAEARRASLADALSRATGARVTLTESVDPSIVGGVVAKVGSVVFDGSVTRQLQRLRQQLLAQR